MEAPKVIRVYGKARRANFQGDTIEREDVIFVRQEGWLRAIDTQDHFVYRRRKGTVGSVLMCTWGSAAGVFGFEAYRQFQSTNMGRMVCCVTHMNTGKHADGATG